MAFLYYIIIYPASKLPFWILYGLADIIYLVMYRLIGYRKSVVRKNLEIAFSTKSEADRRTIERSFYRYLARLFVESVKNISISKKELQRRMKVSNPEIMEELYDRGKSVILAGSHFRNWEYLITAQDFLFRHQAVGIGRTLSNSFMNEKLNNRRARNGMRIIYASIVKEKLAEWKNDLLAILVLFDQRPRKTRSAFWTPFFGKMTPFFFGTERMAVAYNMAVVQFDMEESTKGFYEIHLKLVSDEPRNEAYGAITRRLVSNLEQQIERAPAYWLWSHTRWKSEAPEDLEALKQKLKDKHLRWMESLDEGR